jgi:tetratricopeptide (TPR) repeat protein
MLALAAVLLAAAPADEATVLVEQARTHWEREEFVEAADAFERAHALDPKPDYLFARAQALRFGGRCEDAIAVYLHFIETGPPEDEVVEAKLRMAECQQTIADDATAADAEQPADPAPAVPPPTPPPAPVDDRIAPERRPRSDPAGGALVGTGAVLVAVGVGLVAGASQVAAGSDDAATERDYGDSFTRANQLSAVGISLAAVGGALLIGGIIRYAVLAKKRRRARTAARHGGIGSAAAPP